MTSRRRVNSNTVHAIKTKSESNYWTELFCHEDYSQVLTLSITCTVCGTELNWMLPSKKEIPKHPVLKVALCEGCLLAQSPTSPCQWCGLKAISDKNQRLHCCECHITYCKSCVTLNFGNAAYQFARLQGQGWECFACQEQPEFITLKAICFAANKFMNEMQRLENENASINEETNCSICLSSLVEEPQPTHELPCHHRFHERCLRQWVVTSRSCPLCRSHNVTGITADEPLISFL